MSVDLDVALHGTEWRYKRGCRCAKCVQGHGAKNREQRDRLRMRVAAGDPTVRHGSRTTYGDGRCRCGPCREAAGTYQSEWRQLLLWRQLTGDGVDRSLRGAACVGHAHLEWAEPKTCQEASVLRRICAGCPVVPACRLRVLDEVRELRGTGGSGVVGVWAGRHWTQSRPCQRCGEHR